MEDISKSFSVEKSILEELTIRLNFEKPEETLKDEDRVRKRTEKLFNYVIQEIMASLNGFCNVSDFRVEKNVLMAYSGYAPNHDWTSFTKTYKEIPGVINTLYYRDIPLVKSEGGRTEDGDVKHPYFHLELFRILKIGGRSIEELISNSMKILTQ